MNTHKIPMTCILSPVVGGQQKPYLFILYRLKQISHFAQRYCKSIKPLFNLALRLRIVFLLLSTSEQ